MILRLNIQFFADGPGGEKTEPATAKKLSEARDKGQVAKSKEIANGFGLLALFLIIKVWVGNIGIQFIETFSLVYNKIPEMVTSWSGYMNTNDVYVMFPNILLRILTILAPVFIIAVLVAFICDLAQVKWKIAKKAMQPKLSKLNPISGFKKFFSVNSLVELLKSLIKLLIIGYVVYSYIKDKWVHIYTLYDMPLMQAIQLASELIVEMGIRISAVYIVLAFVDY